MESSDSIDSEISKEMEMLEITSPRKSGPTHYDQYLAAGGWQLIVRIPLPEDYVTAGIPHRKTMLRVPSPNAQSMNA